LSYISFTFILEGITSKKIFETKSDSLRNHWLHFFPWSSLQWGVSKKKLKVSSSFCISW
jgi:hypothetical protein